MTRARQQVHLAMRVLVMLTLGLGMAFPLLYLVSASLMTATDISAFPPHLLPPEIDIDNYVEAYQYLTARTVLNSFLFSIGVVVVQLTLSLPAGFALAKIRFRGAHALVGIFVAPMFLPAVIALIPQYVIVNMLGLVNTYAGMIIPVAAQTAFATLLFRQFFVNLPDGLIEAARVDGAGWFRVLGSIAIPLAGPAVAAYCSVTFLTAWNMYIWPLIVAPSSELRVMSVALAPLAQGGLSSVPPNVTMAAAVISTIPVLVAFLAAQRWFIKGIVGSGLEPS